MQRAAEQAGEVFSRKASGLTRVVSPWTALAYSFVAPNITQASFYLLWAVTLYAGAQMQISIMFMLFAAHPVGETEHETINGKYIAEIMSKDWGFYYTTTLNLGKIRSGLERYKDLFTLADNQNIQERITHLEQMIERAPKALKWKARAAVGPRVQWYNDVEEVERAEHLQNLDE